MGEQKKLTKRRPNRLEFRNISGAGLQIHADIPFNPNCVEFVMKKGFQPIMEGAKNETNMLISYEPWIQFKPKDWGQMLEEVFQEMVDLWNEKYAKPKAPCPFCETPTDKIVVTPMGTKKAFITTKCCYRDQEVVWTLELEKKYGVFKNNLGQ